MKSKSPQISRASVLICFLALTSFLTGTQSSAETISVPGDSPSIKGAMIKARAGDIVLVSCGTYQENDILIKRGVSLWSGTLQPDCVTIDAGEQGRCLIISGADSTTSIVGITFAGGRSVGNEETKGGAILCEDSTVKITRCLFRDNAATTGGAIAVVGLRGPVLDACTFTANSAHLGGAVSWESESGKFSNCTFVNNSASSSGGALTVVEGKIEILDSIFRTNIAGNSGGALSFLNSEAQVKRTVFLANQGGMAGGAITSSGTSLNFHQCTFHANDTDGLATVLSSQESQPVFDHCLLTGSSNPMFTGESVEYVITKTNIVPLGGEPWPAIIAEKVGSLGNIAIDPQFCAPEVGDLRLQSGSPCLASDSRQQIGALSQGCGAQSR